MRPALAALWPEERLAAVYFAAVFLAFLAAGQPFNLLGMGYDYLRFFVSIAALVLPLWLLAQAVRAVRRRFDARRAGEDLLLFARALLPLLLVLVAYTNLKARLFVFRPELADPWLARLDALVHFGGGDFVGWLLGFTGHRALDHFLAVAYVLAWAVFALPLAVAFARHGGRAARRALSALGIAYVVGGFLYYAAPAVGPAFFVRERFAHLAGNLAHTLQSDMLRAMLYLVSHPEEKAIPFFGIAAFPSLHVATTFLGLLVCWTHARWLLLLIVPANLLVAWSALHFGWHYAIDFYPGIALALLAWWGAGRWAGEGNDGLREGTGPRSGWRSGQRRRIAIAPGRRNSDGSEERSNSGDEAAVAPVGRPVKLRTSGVFTSGG